MQWQVSKQFCGQEEAGGSLGTGGIHLPSGQGMEYMDERQEKQTSLAKAASERHLLRQSTGGMGQAEFKAWAEEEPTALENRPDSKER